MRRLVTTKLHTNTAFPPEPKTHLSSLVYHRTGVHSIFFLSILQVSACADKANRFDNKRRVLARLAICLSPMSAPVSGQRRTLTRTGELSRSLWARSEFPRLFVDKVTETGWHTGGKVRGVIHSSLVGEDN